MRTFKDVYKLPFKQNEFLDTWVHDADGHFAFQFNIGNNAKQKLLLDAINDVKQLTNPDLEYRFFKGDIYSLREAIPVITIRGWGNLTGVNGFAFPPEKAAFIQDTLGAYIVEQLNKRQ